MNGPDATDGQTAEALGKRSLKPSFAALVIFGVATRLAVLGVGSILACIPGGQADSDARIERFGLTSCPEGELPRQTIGFVAGIILMRSTT